MTNARPSHVLNPACHGVDGSSKGGDKFASQGKQEKSLTDQHLRVRIIKYFRFKRAVQRFREVAKWTSQSGCFGLSLLGLPSDSPYSALAMCASTVLCQVLVVGKHNISIFGFGKRTWTYFVSSTVQPAMHKSELEILQALNLKKGLEILKATSNAKWYEYPTKILI